MVVDLGGTVQTYAAEFPFPVVTERGQLLILLGKYDSELWVSAKLFDDAGKLVCEIIKNKLRVNNQDAFRIEQTPHTLTLLEDSAKDGGAASAEAKKVLVVDFLNASAVRLFADFYSARGVHLVIDKHGVQFGHDRSLSNTGLNGTGVVLDPPAQPTAQTEPSTSTEPAADEVALREVKGVITSPDDSSGDVGAAMTAAA